MRQKVEDVRHNLLRGLQIVRSLVSSNMHEFQSHISAVAALLLDGALKKGSILVGLDAVETYLVGSRYPHAIEYYSFTIIGSCQV